MKKLPQFVLITLALSSGSVFAQFSQGDIVLEGTFGFIQQEQESPQPQNNSDAVIEETMLTASPKVQYFLNDKFSLVAGVGYRYGITTIEDREASENLLLFSAGFRRYVTVSSKIALFNGFEAGFNFGSGESNLNFVEEQSDITELSAGLHHGVTFELNERMLLTAQTRSLFYEARVTTVDNLDEEYVDQAYGLRDLLNLTVGFAFKF